MVATFAIVLAACAALAGEPEPSAPVVAVLVDDLGHRLDEGMAAIELPGPVAYAILPHAPHAARLADAAHARGKEVVLHLPMEADQNNHLLGLGAITLAMGPERIARVFGEALASVPHAAGVSNHMGSRLTREVSHMRWLMSALGGTDGLFFIDSRTTSGSVAAHAAREARIPFAARDVFLDHVQSKRFVRQQLLRLIEKAREKGSALGIAHPYPVTIAVLSTWRPERSGARLVSLAELIRHQQAGVALQTADPGAGALALARPECGEHGNDADPAQHPYAERQRAD